jgi:uncharacterized membrane protein
MTARLLMITRAAVIAALYVALVLIFQPISFGPVQFRVAEALTLLPFLLPEAIPGLFVGCLIANVFGGFGLTDIVLGSSATLAAAFLTRRAPNKWAAAVPPVVVNGLVVGVYLSFLTGMPMLFSIGYVALGEAGVCFALGVSLVHLLERSSFLGKTIDVAARAQKNR